MQLNSPYVRRGCRDGCEGMELLAAKVGEFQTERRRFVGGQRREGGDGRAKAGGRGGDGRAATTATTKIGGRRLAGAR
jgi:hypothetical protein